MNRVPYPQVLLRDLVERAGVTGQGRLLNLACAQGVSPSRLLRRFARYGRSIAKLR